jgi:hypothetical protein
MIRRTVVPSVTETSGRRGAKAKPNPEIFARYISDVAMLTAWPRFRSSSAMASTGCRSPSDP